MLSSVFGGMVFALELHACECHARLRKSSLNSPRFSQKISTQVIRRNLGIFHSACEPPGCLPAIPLEAFASQKAKPNFELGLLNAHFSGSAIPSTGRSLVFGIPRPDE